MIRESMEIQNETATVTIESSLLAERTPVNTNNESLKVFQLEQWSKSKEDSRIWVLAFDLPGEKVNKLSKTVIQQFDILLSRLEAMGSKHEIDALVLVSRKPGNFIAGADIEMIQAAKTADEAEALSRMGQKLLDRWEDLSFPTVAAVNGAALGGGCEFCLGSSAIVMSNDSSAKIGLPEVLLGLVPGMGGCVRLPRKVGLATAFDLILTGKTLSGERALKAGLIEACLPKENFEDAALRWTRTHLSSLRAGKRLAREPKLGGMGGALGSMLEKSPMKAMIFKKAKDSVMAQTKGKYPAPLEAIDIICSTGGTYGSKLRGSERDQAMEREAKGFGRLAVSEVSKNLIRLFFLTEEVKKSKGLSAGKTAQARTIENAAVLGAGVMGGGIAELFAEKEIFIRMKDLNVKALSVGIQAASRVLQRQVQKKKINPRQMLQKLNHISPTVDYSGFNKTDLVIEAIVENLEIKKKVFQELESQIKPTCLVASNTSSLSVSEMQKVFKNPERFVGMHFFNPVHRMPLVEVIKGEKTSDEAVSTIFQLCKRIGKTPIVVKDSPGFLVNRLLSPYLNESVYLLAEGVSIPELDRVFLEFGMPMGPAELIDEVGIDVAEKVAHVMHEAFGDRLLPATLNQKLVSQERLGKKAGKGLYQYTGSKKVKEFDPQVYAILGITPSKNPVEDEEILERCLLPMINEAARCLEEGVVTSSSEVDLGMIMGTGFPPFRGGLLRYADSLGMSRIVDRLRKYEAKFGARFAPSQAILTRAEHGRSFY